LLDCGTLIKEDAVVRIIERYFKENHIKAIRQRGAGPDFLCEGAAIEVKGSNAPFDDAIQQYVDYLFTGKYKALSVVFPSDFLDVRRIVIFRDFCQTAELLRGVKEIPTYVVTEHKDSYYVKRFGSGLSLSSNMRLYMLNGLMSKGLKDASEETILHNLKRFLKDFDRVYQVYLSALVMHRADFRLPKFELEAHATGNNRKQHP
jgi:hypothetical protein